jgi:hypothetical protein
MWVAMRLVVARFWADNFRGSVTNIYSLKVIPTVIARSGFRLTGDSLYSERADGLHEEGLL